MSLRSRQKARKSDQVAGIALAICGIALIGALAAGTWWVRSRTIELSADTNCPLKGPRSVHLIMIDRSDPASGQQAQRIRQVVQRLKTEAPFGTRFDIYTFEGDTQQELKPVLMICAPGKPEDANELIENPQRVQRLYEERFSTVLDKAMDDLLMQTTRPSSPIIESLRAAALSSFGPFEAGQLPLRLTLISDLVQHSAAISHFRAEPNFEQLMHSPTWAPLRPQLKGAQTDILYMLRPAALRGNTPIQNRGHQAFWEQLIAAAGGRLELFEPL